MLQDGSCGPWAGSTLGIGLLLAGIPACAQDQLRAPINTGRPDQTTGTNLIPRRSLQLESGLRYQRAPAVRAYNYPVLTVRYGLLDWLELRVGASVQDSVRTDSARRPRGLGPPELGTRLHLWSSKGLRPEAALTAAVTLPVGTAKLRPSQPETRLRIGFSNALTNKLSLTYTYGYGWVGGAAEQKYAVKLGASLRPKLAVYGEFFGTTIARQRPDNEVDAGLLWRLRPNLQLDLAAGRGISRAAPSYFVTTGFSVRLPR